MAHRSGVSYIPNGPVVQMRKDKLAGATCAVQLSTP